MKLCNGLSAASVAIGVALATIGGAHAEDGRGTRGFCTADGKATLVFVDRTTAYDDVDSQILDDGLFSVVVGLGAGDRLIIHTIRDDPFSSERVFDGCRPECDGGFWICNPFQVEEEDRKFFRLAAASLRPIREASEKYPRSEIFSTIAAVTRDYREGRIGHVVIFSDLLENSALASRAAILGGRVEQVLSRLKSAQVEPWTSGADVTIYGVGRSDGPERQGLTMAERQNQESVWTAWLKSGGASSVKVYQRFPTQANLTHQND
jgi:hypothetical protein